MENCRQPVNASDEFNRIDSHVHMRLARRMTCKGGQRRWQPGGRLFWRSDWPHRRFVLEHGLYQLLRTIRYPGDVHAA